MPYSFKAVESAFTKAREKMRELLESKPHIILWRESQIHYELTSRLEAALREELCIPWQDCFIFFDVPQSLEQGNPIRSWHLLFKQYRPDTVVLPMNEVVIDNGEPGLCIEVKAVVTTSVLVGDSWRKTFIGGEQGELAHFREDDEKLAHIVTIGGGKRFIGVKYVLHYHSAHWGDVPTEFTGDGWRILHSLYDGKIQVREFMQMIYGEDDQVKLLSAHP